MDFNVESPSNFEEKSICCFVLDVSGSMQGAPIQALNNALQQFHADILNDSILANRLEIAIVEFCNVATLIQPPALAENFKVPTLTTKGTTALVDGVKLGIDVVDERKAWYKTTGQPYKRPWIILMTDGAPDANQNIQELSQIINDRVSKKNFVFYAIGVDGADKDVLNQISHPEFPPADLIGTRFGEFFKWLSVSMGTIVSSANDQKVNLPSPKNWMNGFTV